MACSPPNGVSSFKAHKDVQGEQSDEVTAALAEYCLHSAKSQREGVGHAFPSWPELFVDQTFHVALKINLIGLCELTCVSNSCWILFRACKEGHRVRHIFPFGKKNGENPQIRKCIMKTRKREPFWTKIFPVFSRFFLIFLYVLTTALEVQAVVKRLRHFTAQLKKGYLRGELSSATERGHLLTL